MLKISDKKEIVAKLMDRGNSEARAIDIYEEARKSSNPAFILRHYCIKIEE